MPRSGKSHPARQPTLSLFDPTVYLRDPDAKRFQLAYTHQIRNWYRWEDRRFNDHEIATFGEVVRFEAPWCEHGLLLAGPLVLRVGSRQPTDLSRPRRRPMELSGWVEDDRLKFLRCSAGGILLVELASAWCYLWPCWRDLNLLVACGQGIPQPNARRILHRLAEQFELPVHVLADNDTWGYYLFSVLKRGSIAPHIQIPELALKDVRYLGLRAGEFPPEVVKRYSIPWKNRWDLRLKAMSRYPCFRSEAWQREFEAFRRQRGKVELAVLRGIYGRKGPGPFDAYACHRRFAREYLLPKLRNKDWLT